MTTVTVRPDEAAARQADAQVARVVRKIARPAQRQAVQRPRVPWEHHVLFREPAYTDGQPYTVDDEDDDTDT